MIELTLNTLIAAIVLLLGGAGIGYFFGFLSERRKTDKAMKSVERILSGAKKDGEQYLRDAELKARENFLTQKQKIEEYRSKRNDELSRQERNLQQREKETKRIQGTFADREKELEKSNREVEQLKERVLRKEEQLVEMLEEQNHRLEAMSGISKAEALDQLKQNLLKEAKKTAAQDLHDIRQEIKNTAKKEAKEIIATAVENVATDYVQESTLSSVSLPNDKIKGLIIGKEGRNIKMFESLTNVKVIVDDTPESVVLSSFDPVKREISRLAMNALIKERNINPKTIEQSVKNATKTVENEMRKAANQTVNILKLRNLHPEIMTMLGRLKYRTSYGQNILQHSTEVALLAGALAAELGLDIQLAKRAGLLHDIGKAISNDSNASHVELGVQITERCEEHPAVINAVLAHHEEADPICAEVVLVTAADKISGARPGARRESLEAYTQRIESLEELANSFEGVAKTYALSAGREIRVIVEPDKIDDASATLLASDIAEKIESTMEYPGTITVTVLRRLTTTEYTDNQRKSYAGEGVSA
jgi:ribonuclease Y